MPDLKIRLLIMFRNLSVLEPKQLPKLLNVLAALKKSKPDVVIWIPLNGQKNIQKNWPWQKKDQSREFFSNIPRPCLLVKMSAVPATLDICFSRISATLLEPIRFVMPSLKNINLITTWMTSFPCLFIPESSHPARSCLPLKVHRTFWNSQSVTCIRFTERSGWSLRKMIFFRQNSTKTPSLSLHAEKKSSTMTVLITTLKSRRKTISENMVFQKNTVPIP